MNIFYPSLGIVFVVVLLYYFLLEKHKNILLVNTSILVVNMGLLIGTDMDIKYMKIATLIFVFFIEFISFSYIWYNVEFKRNIEHIAISQIIVFLIYIFVTL